MLISSWPAAYVAITTVSLRAGADFHQNFRMPSRVSEVAKSAAPAKIRRRARPDDGDAARLELGDVTIDVVERRVWHHGEEVPLTATEFDLLAHLMRHPSRVWQRDELLAAVWGYSAAAGSRTVDVHVSQLRGKLGAGCPIRTVRGVGYAADARGDGR